MKRFYAILSLVTLFVFLVFVGISSADISISQNKNGTVDYYTTYTNFDYYEVCIQKQPFGVQRIVAYDYTGTFTPQDGAGIYSLVVRGAKGIDDKIECEWESFVYSGIPSFTFRYVDNDRWWTGVEIYNPNPDPVTVWIETPWSRVTITVEPGIENALVYNIQDLITQTGCILKDGEFMTFEGAVEITRFMGNSDGGVAGF